jgi:hypothetical protein
MPVNEYNVPLFSFNANYSDSAWHVVFDYGYSGINNRHYDHQVRLVRGGQ